MEVASRKKRAFMRRVILLSPIMLVVAAVGFSFAKMALNEGLVFGTEDLTVAKWDVSVASSTSELDGVAGEEQLYEFVVTNDSQVASDYKIEVDGSELPNGYSLSVSLDGGASRPLTNGSAAVFDGIGITLAGGESQNHVLHINTAQNADLLDEIDINVAAIFTQVEPVEVSQP